MHAHVESAGSVELLVSLLERYPELTRLRLEPEEGNLWIGFIVCGHLTQREVAAARRDLKSALKALAWLQHRPLGEFLLRAEGEAFTFLDIRRSITALTPNEFALLAEWMRQSYGPRLVVEAADSWDEEQRAQEEFIETILPDLPHDLPERPLLAYREEGRVFVASR